MADCFTFQRTEKKYLLTEEIYTELMRRLQPKIQLDEYGLHTICNVYYDTPQDELIRHSIEKPVYKEKLRLRSYGVPSLTDKVFLELKKKWKGVVYKRRISLTLKEAQLFLEGQAHLPGNGQIEQEIEYFVQFYQPQPKLYIAYDRMAYFSKEDINLRITFDEHIRSRSEDVYLAGGDAGKLLLDKGVRLMELKAVSALPVWFVRILSELEIYPASFSKYGEIYKKKLAAGNQTNALVNCSQNSQLQIKEDALCFQV